MATDIEVNETSIEACRTCGIYFFTSSNLLRHLFPTFTSESDLVLIRSQLKAWDVEITENDGFPQNICTGCIHEFQKILKFRRTCVETQDNFRYLNNIREKNIQVKTEIPDPDENKFCGFIYVDDISNDEDEKTSIHFTHAPIKSEDILESSVSNEMPYDMSANYEKLCDASMTQNLSSFNEVANFHPIHCSPFQEQNLEMSLLNADNFDVLNKKCEGIKCKLCTHVATNQTMLNQHIQLAHEIKNHECHICGKQFKNSTAIRLKFHIKWHKLSKHIKCPQCGFYCASRYLLNEHKRAVHAKSECEVCGKQLTLKKLKLHMREHEIKAQFPCAFCDQGFYTDSEREQHLWKVHSYSSNNYEDNLPNFALLCAQCDQTFKTTSELEEHVHQMHSYDVTKDISFDKLQKCTDSFNISKEIQQNITLTELDDYQNMLVKKNEQIFEINNEFSDNNKTETTSESISDSDDEDNINKDDMTMTHALEQFACAQCPENFSTVEKLRIHHLEHTQQHTEFKCTICHKLFKLKIQLNRHLKTHTKAPF